MKGCESGGIWEILKRTSSKTAGKVPLKGKAKWGLWKSSELAFGSQASKVSARECKAWALEIARVPLS